MLLFWYEWYDLVRRSEIGCNLWDYQGVAPKGLGIYLRIKVEFYLLKYWSIEVLKYFGVLKYWSIEVLKYWYIEVLSILLSIFAYLGIYCGIIILHLFLVLLDRICVVF